MENQGIIKSVILLAIVATVFGRPTSNRGVETPEIKKARLEVERERGSRPCYARQLEVKADIMQFDEIKGGPHYVPECEKNGIKWRPSQCDHVEEGACFCVHEDTGEVVEYTRDLKLNKEALACGSRANYSDHSQQQCFRARDQINRMQKEYGLILPYSPECTSNGKFMALQRNDMSQFFCVDTDTGIIIPETETKAETLPPLTEDICQAYDRVWHDFKAWNATYVEYEQHVDENSCSAGFLFMECGCPQKCTYKTTVESLKEECVCKPACVCPQGKLELEGRCVTLEECHQAKPSSKTPQADKLDRLTAGDYSRWREFKESNPNIVLEVYNTLGMHEAHMHTGGPAPSYDVNPNSRMLYSEGPPSEEPMEGEHRGGEPIPGENTPYLLQVLKQGGPTAEEVEEYHEPENNEGTEEPIGHYGGEPIPVEGEEAPTLLGVLREGGPTPEEVEEYHEPENFPEVEEEEFTDWEEEEERFPTEYYSPEEEEEYLPEEEQEHDSTETESPQEEETEYITPEEEIEQEYIQTESEEEENEYVPPEEEEVEPENNIRREIEEEEYDEETLNYYRPEGRNTQGEEPTEETEPEGGRMRDDPSQHQNVFSSVPEPEDDELLQHQASTPCAEQDENVTESTPMNQEEEALAEIDRVFTENDVDLPEPIEATMEQPSPSIKKHGSG